MDFELHFQSITSEVAKALDLRIEYSIDYITYDTELSQEERDHPEYELKYNGYYTPLMLRLNISNSLLYKLGKKLQDCFIMNYVEADRQKEFLNNITIKPIKALESLKVILDFAKAVKPGYNIFKEIEELFYSKHAIFSIYKVDLLRANNETELNKLIGFIEEHISLLSEIVEILNKFSLVENYWDNILPPNKDDYYKSDLNRNQLILLFHYLRENKVIHNQTSASAMGVAIEFCTGFSHDQIRKLFPGPDNKNPTEKIECSSKDADELIEKLNQTIISIKEYKPVSGL